MHVAILMCLSVGGGRLHKGFSAGLMLFLAWSIGVSASANQIVASGAGALPGSAQDLTGLYPTEITGSFWVDTVSIKAAGPGEGLGCKAPKRVS